MNEKKSYEILVMADNNDGYVSVSEAKERGIAQTYLVLAEQEGQFKKISKGLYIKKGYAPDPYFIIHHTYKKAVFSLLSAACLHGLVDKQDIMFVNLPRGYLSKGINGVKCRHVGDKEYGLGLALQVSDHGRLVMTYDIERTFIDLIRYRTKLNFDFRDSIKKFFSKNYRIDVLFGYARELDCEKEINLILDLFKE